MSNTAEAEVPAAGREMIGRGSIPARGAARGQAGGPGGRGAPMGPGRGRTGGPRPGLNGPGGQNEASSGGNADQGSPTVIPIRGGRGGPGGRARGVPPRGRGGPVRGRGGAGPYNAGAPNNTNANSNPNPKSVTLSNELLADAANLLATNTTTTTATAQTEGNPGGAGRGQNPAAGGRGGGLIRPVRPGNLLRPAVNRGLSQPLLPSQQNQPQTRPGLPHAVSSNVLVTDREPLGSVTTAGVLPEVLDEKSPLRGLDFTQREATTTCIFQDNGKLKAGTFSIVIRRLTSPNPEHNIDLMRALANRYNTIIEARIKADQIRGILLRLFNVLRTWVTRYWQDFSSDPDTVELTQNFLQEVISTAEVKTVTVAQGVSSAIEKGLQKMTRVRARNDLLKKSIMPPDPLHTSLLDFHPEEIARQITLREWDIWSNLKPWEFLGLAWSKKDKETRAPHETSNFLSHWVTTTIVATANPKSRIIIIRKFIEIADELRKLGNYNGVFEIWSGLHMQPAFRMTESFEAAKEEKDWRERWDALASLTSSEKGFYALTEAIAQQGGPYIPYMGMFLQHLILIEEGNPTKIGEHKLLNHFKCGLIAMTLKKITQSQQQGYFHIYRKSRVIQTKINLLPVVQDEEELYAISLYHQPRPGKPPGPEPEALRKFISLAAAKKQEILQTPLCTRLPATKEAQQALAAFLTEKNMNNPRWLYTLPDKERRDEFLNKLFKKLIEWTSKSEHGNQVWVSYQNNTIQECVLFLPSYCSSKISSSLFLGTGTSAALKYGKGSNLVAYTNALGKWATDTLPKECIFITYIVFGPEKEGEDTPLEDKIDELLQDSDKLSKPVWTFATEKATGERLEKFGFVQSPMWEMPGAPKACGWTRNPDSESARLNEIRRQSTQSGNAPKGAK